METDQIRSKSLSILAKAGLSILISLPVLDDGLELRDQDEVLNRLLSMGPVAAASCGFDRVKSLAWLRREKLVASLTDAEIRFLERGDGPPEHFQTQIEAMWVLAWALCLVPQLDFWKDCDNHFVTLMPNLKVSQSSSELRRKAQLRPRDELVTACDLAYCLHWVIRQAEIEGKEPPSGLKSYVIVERRRALEWLLSKESWDAISLDT
jgi:hypothetical protein